jgi:hypothetical protein
MKMNVLVVCILTVLSSLSGAALAQTSLDTSVTPNATPTVNSENAFAIRKQIKSQNQKIGSAFNSKVITTLQAHNLLLQVTHISQQLRADCFQNKSRKLTSDQVSQLLQMLNISDQAINHAIGAAGGVTNPS